MLDPSALLETIEPRLRQGLAALPNQDRNRLLSITLPLPSAPDALPLSTGRWLYWAQPLLSRTLLGLEPIRLAECAGAERFQTLDRLFHALTQNWTTLDPASTGFRPILFLGFAFDSEDPMVGSWAGLPNAGILIPELLLRCEGPSVTVTFTRRGNASPDVTLARWVSLLEGLLHHAGPSAIDCVLARPLERVAELPSRQSWLHLAREATKATKTGTVEKVVLARHLTVRSAAAIDAVRLLGTLATDYPPCRIFAAKLGKQVLVSASPERLISRSGDRVVCDAIGGTIPRTKAASGDHTLARHMLRDPKTRREHALVVEALGASLTPVCRELNLPQEPGIFRLRNLLHLWTEVDARVAPGTSLLQLVRRLHPTPAVNGTPRRAALEWLRAHEPFYRGWYAGGGGWFDSSGDGEVAVLLRCALLRGANADLYAGAGIVADSDPEAEYAETELKLEAILQALRSESKSPEWPGDAI